MRAFALKTKDGLYIGYSDSDCNPPGTMGAFDPNRDGNYFNHIIVGFVRKNRSGKHLNPDFKTWWKETIPFIMIDKEFAFDVNDVEIVEFEMP